LPVAERAEVPGAVVLADDAEARDRALTALEVAVEDVDRQVAPLDRVHHRAPRVVVVAIGDLPEPDRCRRDVDVAAEERELLDRRRVDARALELRMDDPAVEDA